MNRPTTRYAYLHGFASSQHARKGVALAERFEARGLELTRPDLNRPSFEAQTFSHALEALDEMDDDPNARWRLIGSSMGGYLAARWAQLNPTRVERLVLLCPGFNARERWEQIMGVAAFAQWRREGSLMVPDALGTPRPLRWDLMADAVQHPAEPDTPCPTLILHGCDDETVPVESSRQYSATRDNVRLIELSSNHRLLNVVEQISDECLAFLIDP